MRWIIVLVFLASVCWATAPMPDNMQMPASMPAMTVGSIESVKYTEVMTYPYVPERPLTAEEASFLATFPEWVDKGTFHIREAVRQMLLAEEVHPNKLGYDVTGRDPSRNALHYTELYQSWWAPHAVRIPIQKQQHFSLPALGGLNVGTVTDAALPAVRDISCPKGKDCQTEIRLPGCRQYEEYEERCLVDTGCQSEEYCFEGLVNPGLRLPYNTYDRQSYTGALGVWWESNPSPPENENCPGPPKPPKPPKPGDTGNGGAPGSGHIPGGCPDPPNGPPPADGWGHGGGVNPPPQK